MAEMDWLDRTIHWHKSGDVYAPWAATYDDHALKLWLGDFPDEPLYTLLVDDVEVLTLDDWPDGWIRTVILRDERDGDDLRSVVAYVQKNGDFVIDGQDLGPTVERILGEGVREYEWTRVVEAAEIPKLLRLLGAEGTHVLTALETWMTSHEPGELGSLVSELETLIDEQRFRRIFWSRMGD
jgi:hypothetical protein